MADPAIAATGISRDALDSLERLLQLDPGERAAQLEVLRNSSPELYSQVLTLLSADRSADACGFLSGNAIAHAQIEVIDERSPAAAGMSFGAYEIERSLGAGGMGEVWLARRADGRFAGRVALKVLHGHVAQSSARERFFREGGILGQLSHPNIARLLDAGAMASGVSYLVLEYVEGLPIDRWCDDRSLELSARLRLLLQVCNAVTHAHQHLVVHRDIKPANILVTAEGQVKLLDFGVAKLVAPDVPSAETELTRSSGRALTPDFAAPEQILGQPITTATDVYALGVLLYLLLSGRRPYRRQHLTGRDLERDALETDATPLSHALAEGDDPNLIAARRASTPQRLRRALKGDLENIAAKAMRREPQRRYASVEQLAADVGRHLGGHPVLATRDSWTYRARKFASRHGFGVGVAAAAAILLTGFALAMFLQAERTARERTRAERVSSFLVGLFELSNPYESDGDQIRARELLDTGARRVRAGFADQPETRATLLGTIGRVYNRIGLDDEAMPLLEEALRGLIQVHGPEHPEIATTLNEMGNVLAARGELDAAEARLQEALRMRRKLHGDEAPEVAATLMDLGRLALERGKPAAAEKLLRDSVRLYARLGLGKTPDAANVMNELASLQGYVGHFDEAAKLLETAFGIDRPALGADHPRVIMETHNLAVVRQAQGRMADAESLFRTSNEQLRRVLGPQHPHTIDALANYGRFLRISRDLPAAEQVLREVLDLNLRLRGSEHSMVVNSRVNLATVLHDAGRRSEAETLFREAAQEPADGLPSDHPFLAAALAGLGRVLVERGQSAEALPLLRRSVDIATESMPADSPMLAIARGSLAAALVALEQYEEAAPLLQESYPKVIASQGEHSAIGRQLRDAKTRLERARIAGR